MFPKTIMFYFLTKTLGTDRTISVNLENKVFMGRVCQILMRDKLKSRSKAGKMLNFPGL